MRREKKTHLMPPKHASDAQLGNCRLGTLDVMRIAPAAAGNTAVYSNTAEVSPLQVAPAAALAADATSGGIKMG